MKKTVILVLCMQTGFLVSRAQQAAIREGNQQYREGHFDEAIKAYDRAIEKGPGDITAMYNRSNALAKKGDKAAAMVGYNELIAKATDPVVKQRALYDKGVLHQQQQELDESIEAWKAALKQDPGDKAARENLEKALREKKKQQENKEPKKEPKEKKEQEKPKPEPPQSKLSPKQVEQLLKALEQKEKEVQKKLQQKSASPNQPEKDW